MPELKTCIGEAHTLISCIESWDNMMRKAIEENEYETLSLTQGEFEGTGCIREVEDGVIVFQDHGNDVEIRINFEANYDSDILPYYCFTKGELE